jgi:hypothetical protein
LESPGRWRRQHPRGPGVAIREFKLNPGRGYADYLPYLDGKAVGAIAAKQEIGPAAS